jgi:hypothetical protein
MYFVSNKDIVLINKRTSYLLSDTCWYSILYNYLALKQVLSMNHEQVIISVILPIFVQ